jgi:hypothetical protein
MVVAVVQNVMYSGHKLSLHIPGVEVPVIYHHGVTRAILAWCNFMSMLDHEHHTIRRRIVDSMIGPTSRTHESPLRSAACVHGPGGLGCRDRVRSMHAEQYVGTVAGWLYGAADADTYTSSVQHIHSYI